MEGMHRGFRRVASIGAVVAALAAHAADAPTGIRPGIASKWLLVIGGQQAGELVAYQPPQEDSTAMLKPGVGDTRNPLTRTGRETASLKLASALATPATDWLRAAIGGTATSKTLEIDAMDSASHLLSTTTLGAARITRIELPAFDASSKDQGWVQVQVETETVKTTPGAGSMVRSPASPAVREQWLTSGYRLTVGTLDGRGVTHIEPLAFRFGNTASAVAFPELRFVVGAPALDAYTKLATANLRATGGLTLRLEVLSTSGRTLYTLVFQQAYMTKFAPGRDAKGPNATVWLAPTRVTFEASTH